MLDTAARSAEKLDSLREEAKDEEPSLDGSGGEKENLKDSESTEKEKSSGEEGSEEDEPEFEVENVVDKRKKGAKFNI